MATQASIIYLNGVSSCGKTSIAKSLQEVLDGHYLHTGLDHFNLTLPPGFIVFSDGSDSAVADGALWLTSEGSGRTIAVEPGPAG